MKAILFCFLVKVQTASINKNTDSNSESVQESDALPLEAVHDLTDISESSKDATRTKKSYYPVSFDI